MKKSSKPNRLLVIGGAGFIGINTADYFLSRGWKVSIFDNLSRRGAKSNLAWLGEAHGKRAFRFYKNDIVTDTKALQEAVGSVDAVIHLAGQVAVTTSVQDPKADFLTNALGTLHVLEAVRASKHKPSVLYASTNKVYGNIPRRNISARGVSEAHPLDFHSPYGVSKGAGDQYVRDYARVYGLDTVVFRQSCIYGPRQFGVEDQGWVAWFAIAATTGKPITIYGDGHQARDLLHVKDLCRLYEQAILKMPKVRGNIYNVGGGPANVLSLRQTLSLIQKQLGSLPPVSYADWRPGDQKIYVSDNRKALRDIGWRPTITASKGVASLIRWVKQNAALFQ